MKGYKNIFWGIFITTFNIKFGWVKILPAFIGLIFILKGLDHLYEETTLVKFGKTKTIATIAIFMSLIGEALEFRFADAVYMSIPMVIWTVTYLVVELLLYFETLEASIEYLNVNNQVDLSNSYIGSLRFYTIMSIINIILLLFASLFNRGLIIITAFIAIISKIYLLVLINRLKQQEI